MFKKNFFFRSLSLALIVRLSYQLIAVLAVKFIPFKASFPYADTVLAPLAPWFIWFWGNFDGVHYLKIAQYGYDFQLGQAFFPFYPILIKWFNHLIHNPLIAALIISHLAFIGFLYFFIKLGVLDYSKKTLKWAVLLLLLFPTSFFFFGVYTESLFLFFATAAFYFARTKRFALAFILVGLASATRLIGIFLLPAIIWEFWQSKPLVLKWPKTFVYSLLGSGGLLFYLNFLRGKFNDIFIFVSSQPGFGAGRQVDKLIMIYQVIFRYLKMFFSVSLHNEIYFVLVFEFIIALSFLALIIYTLVKKFRTGYLWYIIPSFLLPTFTGTFASMPRYVLTLFPLFYLLGSLKSLKIKVSLLIIFTLILIWAFIRFSRGYWLA